MKVILKTPTVTLEIEAKDSQAVFKGLTALLERLERFERLKEEVKS